MRYTDDIRKAGGLAAREKNGPLWFFLPENDGSFLVPMADHVSRLYFPLMNRHGMKCSVTPELKGDIASAFQHYLTAATVTEELHRNVSGRNFWISVKGKNPWSAAGNSAFQKADKWSANKEVSEVEGHVGAFIVRRKNDDLGLETEATVFVPDTDDHVELMVMKVTNISDATVTFVPAAATPIFGRHADNFRDHRQVTTMFQKVYLEDHGVRVKPTIVHDEHGHAVNRVNYAVLGYEQDGTAPSGIWSRLMDFIGEGGSLDNPEAVTRNLAAPRLEPGDAHGHEAVGAFRFSEKTLKPGEHVQFIILHGITEDPEDIQRWKVRYGNLRLAEKHLRETLVYWQETTSGIAFHTGDTDFNNWTRWVTFQLKCRQIFGNSYLPDFGYGRGGRGWRDLWQDLLSIFLIDPSGARDEILNNFKGIRIDGSNATIIGTRPGEFVADRNNVPRTWCDHGAWPVFVVNFYLDQTGDYDLLLEEMTYWKDQHIFRSKKTDEDWTPETGTRQLDVNGKEYLGTMLEHMLVQQLSAFFNVGDHNNILLEGADWNDTLDMAREKGESVCFHSFYAHNLDTLASMLEVLRQRGHETIPLASELDILLDRLPDSTMVDYGSPRAKQERLAAFFTRVSQRVSGVKRDFPVTGLVRDLREKAAHMAGHVRDNEWLTTGEGHQFFNGHYNNLGERVHGDHPLGIRMDLTSQVIPVMCGVANKEQVSAICKSTGEVLRDKESGGLRLCTDFRELDLNIGRITGFVYGNKEHGSKWMQQNIMLAYGLYREGFAKEGHEVLREVYELATRTENALIFPGIPSYFASNDRGAYAYLTGSSSWLLLTLLTRVFGVRGEQGDLVIAPALDKEQFDPQGKAAVDLQFAGRKVHVQYANPALLGTGEYRITGASVNGKPHAFNDDLVKISRKELDSQPAGEDIDVSITLGNNK